jgi:hypothetical protein
LKRILKAAGAIMKGCLKVDNSHRKFPKAAANNNKKIFEKLSTFWKLVDVAINGFWKLFHASNIGF